MSTVAEKSCQGSIHSTTSFLKHFPGIGLWADSWCVLYHDRLCWDYYRVQNYHFTWQFGHRVFHRQQQQHLRSAPEHLDCMPQFCGKREKNTRSTSQNFWEVPSNTWTVCLSSMWKSLENRTIGLYTYLLDLFLNSTVRRVAVTKMRTVAPIITQVNAILLGRCFWAAIVTLFLFLKYNFIWKSSILSSVYCVSSGISLYTCTDAFWPQR